MAMGTWVMVTAREEKLKWHSWLRDWGEGGGGGGAGEGEEAEDGDGEKRGATMRGARGGR